MKNKIFFVILAIAGMFTIATMCSAQTVYNFNEGLEKAKSQNKKVLVNIYSETDSWCVKMETVYTNESIKSIINSNFIYVKLNGQGSEKYIYNEKQIMASELAKLLGVTGYPTHVFLNSDGSPIKFKYNGEIVNSYPGYVEASEFEKILKFFSGDQYKDTDLSKIL
jgi:thioredoxin-related protein